MLPSKGYFNALECPFYITSQNCLRPYCHFKHPKRDVLESNSLLNKSNDDNKYRVHSDKTSNPLIYIPSKKSKCPGRSSVKLDENVYSPTSEITSLDESPESSNYNLIDSSLMETGLLLDEKNKHPILDKVKSSNLDTLKPHIPITSMPLKPAAISIDVKKSTVDEKKSVEKVKVAPVKKIAKSEIVPFLGSFDYNPVPDDDGAKKTYSRYSYEKGHDSGDEIMGNYKIILDKENSKMDNSGIDDETSSGESFSNSELDKHGESNHFNKQCTGKKSLHKDSTSRNTNGSLEKKYQNKRKPQNSIDDLFEDIEGKGKNHANHSFKQTKISKNEESINTLISHKVKASKNKPSRHSSNNISKKSHKEKSHSNSRKSKHSNKKEKKEEKKYRSSKKIHSKKEDKKKSSHSHRHSTHHSHSSSKSKSKSDSTSKLNSKKNSKSSSELKKEKSTILISDSLSDDTEDDLFDDLINNHSPPSSVEKPLQPSLSSSKESSQNITNTQSNDLKRTDKMEDEVLPKPGKIRIAHVPNVSSFLSAKEQIKNVSSSSKPINKFGMIAKKNAVLIQSKKGNKSALERPVIEEDNNLKIPILIRQSGLNNLYDELIQHIDPYEAISKAVAEENAICSKVLSERTYKNCIAMAVLKIRKSKGDIGSDQKNLVMSSDAVLDFTHGLTLYECISQYLMSPEEFVCHGYPLEGPKPGSAYIDKNSYFRKKFVPPTEDCRTCIKCWQEFTVDENGIPETKNDCHYHWGKLYVKKKYGQIGQFYSCCESEGGSDPCYVGPYHLAELKNEDCLEGFLKTPPFPHDKDINKAGIFAIDCEMCYTTQGLEVVRCSMISIDDRDIYDVLIKPDYPVLDYLTRFSGVTAEMLLNVTTRLEDVQKYLLSRIYDKTILIGHSLENDLKALKIMHFTVVDTSILYQEKDTTKKKPLKALARDICNLRIQSGESGHDSIEDSRACIKLVLAKVKNDAKSHKPRVTISLGEVNNS